MNSHSKEFEYILNLIRNEVLKKRILFCQNPEYCFTLTMIYDGTNSCFFIIILLFFKMRNGNSDFLHFILYQIHIEKKNHYLFFLMNTFFFSKNLVYSNTESKGQYTGWLEEVICDKKIHQP